MTTSAAGWVRSLFALAQSQGLDAHQLFHKVGWDAHQLSKAQQRYSQEQLNQLWDLLVSQTGNPTIGLELGRHVTPATFGAVGYVWLSSATLGDALQHFLHYQRYLAEALRAELYEQGAYTYLSLRHMGSQSGHRSVITDALLSAFMYYTRWVMQKPILPYQIWLHYEPATLTPYEQLFGCPILSKQPETAIVLPSALLNSALPSHDPELLTHHVQLADQWQQQSAKPVSHQVRQLLLQLLPNGQVQQHVVAERLFVTTKTLQRRLEQEQTSFKHLLETCRFELACQYLSQDSFSLQDVAALTGYSDYSAFAKAFRQWSGYSPKDWRKQAH